MISNELLNYITDIDPVNDRIMSITLGGTMPITCICNYSRTAAGEHTTEQKEEHYKQLKQTQEKHQSKGPTYVLGDFNARIQRN